MIEVKRNRVVRLGVLYLPDDLNDLPDVADLEDSDSLAVKETVKAIAHVEDPANNPKPKFAVYSHDDVKKTLIELFHLKCAYCEIRVTSARDIEHFRPKGRIDPGTGKEVIKPGYYWLAATWDNLLLSCPDCNQRKRALVRDETGKWTFAEDSTGKLDLFPLREGGTRVTSHLEDVEDEEDARLLLNPCSDKVSKHLRFDKKGNIFPRRVNGKVSDMAKASIGVYVLWRPTLVEARKVKFLDMVRCAEEPLTIASSTIKHFQGDELSAGFRDTIRASLLRTRKKLKAFANEDEEFAGMARWLIKDRLKELKEVEQRFEAKFGN